MKPELERMRSDSGFLLAEFGNFEAGLSPDSKGSLPDSIFDLRTVFFICGQYIHKTGNLMSSKPKETAEDEPRQFLFQLAIKFLIARSISTFHHE